MPGRTGRGMEGKGRTQKGEKRKKIFNHQLLLVDGHLLFAQFS